MAVAVDRDIDNAWVHVDYLVYAESQSVHDSRSVTLGKHVGLSNQGAQRILVVVGLEIEIGRFLTDAGISNERLDLWQTLAADLENFGAHASQGTSTGRAGQDTSEVEHS